MEKEGASYAIKSFDGPEYVMPPYQYQRWEVLAEKIVSLFPNRGYTCFRATGGTEAVEIALKAAKSFNKKEKFIAFKGAYHGQSFAAMSLVRIPDHDKHFGPFSSNFIQVEANDWENTTKKVVELIENKDVCAFISEPIICNLGIIVPPKSFFEKVYAACKENNTVFISDEVATGFGRTGKWFGFQHYGLEPDIVILAKGFSSGYGGIGATVIKKEVAEAMRFDFSNYSTFGWHPLATEATIANIDYLKKNGLVEISEKNGAYLKEKLAEFCNPEGLGLCVGFIQKTKGSELKCLQDGLLVFITEGRFTLFPPLDISKAEIDHAVGVIRKNY